MNTIDIIPENIRTEISITEEKSFSNALSETLAPLLFYRKEGWETFRSLNWPSKKDERWRFGEPKAFIPEGYFLGNLPSGPMLNLVEARSKRLQSISGELIFADGQLASASTLSADLQAQGVCFMSIEEAFQACPELIKSYYFRQSPCLGSEKWQALHQAYAGTGSFLYVPDGVKIEAPFIVYHWAISPHVAIFPHTLLVAGESSQVSLIDVYQSFDQAAPSFSCGLSHTYAATGAEVLRKSMQLFNQQSTSIQVEATWAEENARVNTVSIQLGSAYSRFENQAFLEGLHSDIKLASLSVAGGNQQMDQRSLQVHKAASASSDLLYKNALRNKAKTLFSGMILVEPGAQQTDAYQTNRNLLLSEEAEAIAMPGLQIEANDVKCSHGATSAPLEEEALFYLQSRGLSRSAAEELLAFGFFEEIIDRVDQKELVDFLYETLSARFSME